MNPSKLQAIHKKLTKAYQKHGYNEEVDEALCDLQSFIDEVKVG